MRIVVTLHGALASSAGREAAAPFDLELAEPASPASLIASLGLDPAAVAAAWVGGELVGDRTRPLADGSAVSLLPLQAEPGAFSVTIDPCDPQPACLSLDPGTRVKTHLVRVVDAAGALLWSRSIYSQYDTREVTATSRRVIVGYDDRVVSLDWATAAEHRAYRLFLFEYFEAMPGERVLVKEKGSVLVLDALGDLVWEHGSSEVLAAVHVHEGTHVFVHFWTGSEVDGLRVPFACLSADTGQLDMAGPATPPPFERLAARDQVAGPRNTAGLAPLRENCRQLALRHPTPWIQAMAEYVSA